jgi:hypothetical protein
MPLSNSERQARYRDKRDAEFDRLRKGAVQRPPKAAPAASSSAALQLIEARKEIERLRKRVDEANNYLFDVEGWMSAADKVVRGRRGVMTRLQWLHIVKCLHPDSRPAMSIEDFDRAFRIVETNKHLLLDEQQMPTPQRGKCPLIDWEARMRWAAAQRKQDRAAKQVLRNGEAHHSKEKPGL